MGSLNFEDNGRGALLAQFVCANGYRCAISVPVTLSPFGDDFDTAVLTIGGKRAGLSKELASELGRRLLAFGNGLDQEI